MRGRPGEITIVLLAAVALVASGARVARPQERAGDGVPRRLSSLNPFHRQEAGPEPPVTLDEVGRRIDEVGEGIRDDGFVILKQPDVYSQARMTKSRRDFEAQMKAELASFKTILAGRVARLDTAAVESQTALGASLGPSTSSVTVATPTAANPPVLPVLTGESTAPRFLEARIPVGRDDYNLGLEPTIVLDEKQRYLNHLDEIRRVNLGADGADSAGYGLYLLRMPLSITPGECTVMGHGAEVTVTAKHDFPADFLPSTYRNLVINDLVDLLGPTLFEVVRARDSVGRQIEELTARLEALDKQKAALEKSSELGYEEFWRAADESLPGLAQAVKRSPGALTLPDARILDDLAEFVLATDAQFRVGRPVPKVVAGRLDLVAATLAGSERISKNRTIQAAVRLKAREFADRAAQLRKPEAARPGGPDPSGYLATDLGEVQLALILIVTEALTVNPSDGAGRFQRMIDELAATATADDKHAIDAARAINAERAQLDGDRAGSAAAIEAAREKLKDLRKDLKSTSLTSNRAAKRTYPIAPRELPSFLLDENLAVLADDLARAKVTERVRSTDVRSYLRQQLSVAFDLMANPVTTFPPPGAVGPDGRPIEEAIGDAPLSRLDLMDEILRACHARAFDDAPPAAGVPDLAPLGGPTLGSIYHGKLLKALPARLSKTPLGALCWAIAVDAALLDEALRDQVKAVALTNGRPCPDLGPVRFYWPTPEACSAFEEYVTLRWPIVTFAVDPTADQQNLLDNFSLRRDLQLALAFSFSTGKINFSQLDSFRRKVEVDNETIALNKTVTSFVHGHETFGWRITPRFQTPPLQGNLATLGSTLLRGSPGPNYALRKAKLEPGQRELTAVVVLPSFLPSVRVEAVGNWFRLDDPEHPVVQTRRMLEQGRKVQELRLALASACNAGRYRPTDVRFLSAKIDQIEATLPIQSRVVPLPFDNAANGFDLFTQGTTALVPELSGFEGVDAIVGGRECDLLIFGRFISIHETRIVAGGRYLPDTPDYVEVLSREVVRVRIPGDVLPSRTHEGGLSVELYLATPNGISNRVLIPFEGKPGDRAVVTDPNQLPGPQPKPAKEASGDARTADPGVVTVNMGTAAPAPAPSGPAKGGEAKPPATSGGAVRIPQASPATPVGESAADSSGSTGLVVPAAYARAAVDPAPTAAEALEALLPAGPRAPSSPIVINPRVTIAYPPASPPQAPTGVGPSPTQVTVVPPGPAPKEKEKHHSKLRDLGSRLMPRR